MIGSETRAKAKGRQAAMYGRPVSSCAYVERSLRIAWLEGHKEGKHVKADG